MLRIVYPTLKKTNKKETIKNIINKSIMYEVKRTKR